MPILVSLRFTCACCVILFVPGALLPAACSWCDAYNQSVTQCEAQKEQISSLESKKFKGMTVSEQAIMFDEKVTLISLHDELQDELVDAKIAIAKFTWQQEHERLYRKQRNKLIYKILKRPLSVEERQGVIDMLRATGPYWVAVLACIL